MRIQIHCILHCPGGWVESDYFQRMLASEVQPLHCIPVVCRPLWHPAHPSGHHTPCHILFHCTPPLCPLLHWCYLPNEVCLPYYMYPDLYNRESRIVATTVSCWKSNVASVFCTIYNYFGLLSGCSFTTCYRATAVTIYIYC